MKIGLRTWLKSSGIFYLLTVSLLLVIPPSVALSQHPFDPTKTEQVETTEQHLEHLQLLLSKSRQSLSSSQPVLEMTPAEQLGATPEEIEQKKHLLSARVFLYSNYIASLRNHEETRRSSEDLAAKSEAWQGFDQAAPYPIDLVDELRDSIHAQSLAIAKNEVNKTLIDQELEEARNALVISEKELRLRKELLEKPLLDADQIRTNWLNDLGQLKNEVAQTKVLGNQARLQGITASTSLYKKREIFLERQLQVAAKNTLFSEEDLEQKLALLTKKMKAVTDKEKQSTGDNLHDQENLYQARSLLLQAREALSQTESDPEEKTEEINYLQQVVETRKAQTDSSAQLVRLQKLWIMGIKEEIFSWKERYRLANNSKEGDLKQTHESLESQLTLISKKRIGIETNLKLVREQMLNVEHHLTMGTLTSKEYPLAKQKLAVYKHQTKFTIELLTYIDDLTRNTQRFQDEISYYRQQNSISDRLQGFFYRSGAVADSIWSYELFVVEDKIYINGQEIVAQRPVTISKVVLAILILVFGFWITVLLKHRLSLLLVKIFRVEADIALVVEKFLLIIATVVLIVIALISVKIPLTVFAFMGGALAIGIGLGAQGVINNFLSGIILLFERSIKPGDLIEVEGTKGKVISVGLRCSQIRSFDGIDILVPNSNFLQKSVTNWTLSDRLLRLQVKIGVAYGSPTREVTRIIENALEEHGKILKSPEPIVLFEDFGDSSLIFNTYFWIEIRTTLDYRIIASDLRHMLEKRLDEANITIAFPQLDVHLKRSVMKT